MYLELFVQSLGICDDVCFFQISIVCVLLTEFVNLILNIYLDSKQKSEESILLCYLYYHSELIKYYINI